MKTISMAAMPAMIFLILTFGYAKNVSVYDTFLKGAKNGLIASKNIVIPLVGLLTAVFMMRASGLSELLCNFLAPLTEAIGFPSAALPIALLKPISGSASLAMLQELFKTNGPDSFSGRVASVISGSTETTFYTLTIYFGAVGIRKTRHCVAAALCADLTGFLVSAIVVTYFLGK